MSGKDIFGDMHLANVSTEYDKMYSVLFSTFNDKTWFQGCIKIGIYPEYIMKEWLKIAIKKGDVITDKNDDDLQVFKFKGARSVFRSNHLVWQSDCHQPI